MTMNVAVQNSINTAVQICMSNAIRTANMGGRAVFPTWEDYNEACFNHKAVDCVNAMCEARGIDRHSFRFLYGSNGFQCGFSWYSVMVYHDKERNRLVKFVDGEMTGETMFPRNWFDKGDGRRWKIKNIERASCFFTPKVKVTFVCKLTGKTLEKVF
jgi:hypothetical protein